MRAWRLTPPDRATVHLHDVGRFHVDNGAALRDAAVERLGVAYLPLFLVGPDIAAGRLLTLPTDHGTEDLPVHAMYPHRRHLSAKVRLFVDRLSAELAEGTPSTTARPPIPTTASA